MYDSTNIFAKIIRKEIPCKIIYEDDTILAFNDINPRAQIHSLVIPKIEAVSFSDFITNNNNETIADFFKKVNYVASNVLNLKDFRLQINNGANAGQEVFHFHVHILGN
jgi:histidine triad (HIT) family protein